MTEHRVNNVRLNSLAYNLGNRISRFGLYKKAGWKRKNLLLKGALYVLLYICIVERHELCTVESSRMEKSISSISSKWCFGFVSVVEHYAMQRRTKHRSRTLRHYRLQPMH